jgi:hypothetical protein
MTMKYSILLFCFGLYLSCSDKDEIVFSQASDLQGVWLLVEQYADPGDGSGDFKKVNSSKTIQFFADGTFSSNSSLCNMNIESDSESNGNYFVRDELNKYSSENYLTSENCDVEGYKVMLQFDSSNLLLYYQCFEGCVQKFIKK